MNVWSGTAVGLCPISGQTELLIKLITVLQSFVNWVTTDL